MTTVSPETKVSLKLIDELDSAVRTVQAQEYIPPYERAVDGLCTKFAMLWEMGDQTEQAQLVNKFDQVISEEAESIAQRPTVSAINSVTAMTVKMIDSLVDTAGQPNVHANLADHFRTVAIRLMNQSERQDSEGPARALQHAAETLFSKAKILREPK